MGWSSCHKHGFDARALEIYLRHLKLVIKVGNHTQTLYDRLNWICFAVIDDTEPVSDSFVVVPYPIAITSFKIWELLSNWTFTTVWLVIFTSLWLDLFLWVQVVLFQVLLIHDFWCANCLAMCVAWWFEGGVEGMGWDKHNVVIFYCNWKAKKSLLDLDLPISFPGCREMVPLWLPFCSFDWEDVLAVHGWRWGQKWIVSGGRGNFIFMQILSFWRDALFFDCCHSLHLCSFIASESVMLEMLWALRGLEGMAGHQERGGELVDQVDLMAGVWWQLNDACILYLHCLLCLDCVAGWWLDAWHAGMSCMHVPAGARNCIQLYAGTCTWHACSLSYVRAYLPLLICLLQSQLLHVTGPLAKKVG